MNLILIEPAELAPSGEVRLADGRARHILAVLRAQPDQTIRLGVVDGRLDTFWCSAPNDAVNRGGAPYWEQLLPGDGFIQLHSGVELPAHPDAVPRAYYRKLYALDPARIVPLIVLSVTDHVADNPIGMWNTFYIKIIGDKVTVKLNGKLVVDNTPLENRWDAKAPLPARGPIELQHHGDHLWFKNIYIKELPD